MSERAPFQCSVLSVSLYGEVGGPQRRMLQVASALRKRGVETIFAVPKRGGDAFAKLANVEGFRVERLLTGSPTWPGSLKGLAVNVWWLACMPAAIWVADRIIRTTDVDVVHLNGLLAVVPALAARIRGRGIVWHLPGSLYPRWLIQIMMPLVKILADRIVFVSVRVMNTTYGETKEEMHLVVPEPVDTNYYQPKKVNSERMRRSLGLARDDRIVVSVGNITRVKQFEVLVRGVCHLQERAGSQVIRLLIVGKVINVEYQRALTRLVQDRCREDTVRFLGFRDDVREILGVADVFALASRSEGTPIAILEAMAMEVPVVASAVGGIPDLVVDGVTGVLVKDMNPTSVGRAIRKVLTAGVISEQMGVLGRDRVKRKYSMERCVSSHHRLYTEVAGKLGLDVGNVA